MNMPSQAVATAPAAEPTMPVAPLLQRWGPWLLLALLAALPWLCQALGLDYYLGFARRLLIVALIAASLNLLIGFGGLVALGQAGFVGVGAYTLAAANAAGLESAWALWTAAAAAGALAAAATGAIALRTRGVYFIMITLAFAQMLYYLAVSLRALGGDDGFNLPAPLRLGAGLDTGHDRAFYLVVLALAVVGFVGLNHLLGSRFGHALCASRDNEARCTALGYPVFRIRLLSFTLAGALAGLGGALLVSHNGFVSPSGMHWTQSANLVVMVVLGGLGRRWGAPVGVLVWMVLEETLRQWTDYWHWPLGLLLIAIVLRAPDGLCALADPARRAGRR